VYYFGSWEDLAAALRLYLDQKDALLAGRKPRAPDDQTVRDLVNRFLSAKKALVETGAITGTTSTAHARRSLNHLVVSESSMILAQLTLRSCEAYLRTALAWKRLAITYSGHGRSSSRYGMQASWIARSSWDRISESRRRKCGGSNEW